MDTYTVNPETRRRIRVGGERYKDLVSRGVIPPSGCLAVRGTQGVGTPSSSPAPPLVRDTLGLILHLATTESPTTYRSVRLVSRAWRVTTDAKADYTSLLRLATRDGRKAIPAMKLKGAPPVVREALVRLYLPHIVVCATREGRRAYRDLLLEHKAGREAHIAREALTKDGPMSARLFMTRDTLHILREVGHAPTEGDLDLDVAYDEGDECIHAKLRDVWGRRVRGARRQ